MYSKLESKKEEGKEMRMEGGYNFYARDCVKHFTAIISLNIFNIIIQFIDVKLQLGKVYLLAHYYTYYIRKIFTPKFVESILILLRLHSVLYTLVLCLLLSKLL